MNKTYAIADTHGIYPLWRQVIDSLDETDKLYFLGDAADRGPDGWKIIKEALADPRVIYIRGNHDEMLLEAWRSDWRDIYLWHVNGGYETYNDVLMDANYEIYLIQLAKSKLYHCYENKEGQRIHLSHAGFTLMYGDKIPDKEELLWGRDHINDRYIWWSEENPNDYLVHGHTYCASSRFDRVTKELNETRTVGRYCSGHKICIDGRSFMYNKIAMLDLDTLKETVFEIAE